MYCGDETGAFVGDIGSHTSRFGYGGEDAPKVVVPSYTYNGRQTTKNNNNNIPISILRPPNNKTEDIVPIFRQPPSSLSESSSSSSSSLVLHPDSYLQDGIIENWDAWESGWKYAFDVLRVRDGLKHSRGGNGTPSSTTIYGDGGGGEGKCTHPLLAVDCGYTAYSEPESSSSSPDIILPSTKTESTTEGNNFGSHHLAATARQIRTKMTEILFESFDAPAVFIAPSPMLSAFAHGRQTALVVDVGGSGSRVTPVVDGLILSTAQRRSGRGGEWLGEVGRRVLMKELMGVEQQQEVKPRYEVRNMRRRRRREVQQQQQKEGETTTTTTTKKEGKDEKGKKETTRFFNNKSSLFHQWAVRDVMYEMKTCERVRLEPYRTDLNVPFLYGVNKESTTKDRGGGGGEAMDTSKGSKQESEDEEEEEEDSSDEDNGSPKQFELPDGTRVDLVKGKVGKDLCRLPELFFTDEIPFCNLSETKPCTTTSSSQQQQQQQQQQHSILQNQTLSTLPLHKLAHSSLSAIGDGDARKELCGNIILTGSSSLYPNFEQRLSTEMANVAPSTYKCRIIASRNSTERRYGAWIGGSVLTSLGSFQQLWLSRAEYEEYGVMLGVQRFP